MMRNFTILLCSSRESLGRGGHQATSANCGRAESLSSSSGVSREDKCCWVPLTFMGREHKSLITVKLLGFTSPKMGLWDSLSCRLSMRTWEVLKSRRTEPARDVTSQHKNLTAFKP